MSKRELYRLRRSNTAFDRLPTLKEVAEHLEVNFNTLNAKSPKVKQVLRLGVREIKRGELI